MRRIHPGFNALGSVSLGTCCVGELLRTVEAADGSGLPGDVPSRGAPGSLAATCNDADAGCTYGVAAVTGCSVRASAPAASATANFRIVLSLTLP